MRNYYLLIGLLLILICTACENEVSYKQKNMETKLVLNSLLNTDNDTNYVYIGISGNYPYHACSSADGIANIYINDELKETSVYTPRSEKDIGWSPDFPYPIYSTFRPGDKVRIEAFTKDGKLRAWAENTFPAAPQIVRIDTMSVKLKEYSGDYNLTDFLRFKITIKDDPNKKNYYRLVTEQTSSLHGWIGVNAKDTVISRNSYKYIAWEDIALSDGHPMSPEDIEQGMFPQTLNSYGIFDDSFFSGELYTLTINVPVHKNFDYFYYSYEGVPFKKKQASIHSKISLLAITEDEYLYMRALNFYDSDNYDEIFSEPVRFKSNVNGGLGIVGASSEDNRELLIYEHQYE